LAIISGVKIITSFEGICFLNHRNNSRHSKVELSGQKKAGDALLESCDLNDTVSPVLVLYSSLRVFRYGEVASLRRNLMDPEFVREMRQCGDM
jgi:hypothetical protein